MNPAARAALAAVLVAACHKDPPAGSQAPAAAPPEPPPSAAPPADHLAADELVEGDKQAFGVVLPRDLHVDGMFADLVVASGKLAVHPLVKYFRARLSGGSVREGEDSATFDQVHVPDKAGAQYTVRIHRTDAFTRVEFRDTTPKAQPDLPNDEARWRRAGLTPQGRLLDPTHIE